MRTISEHNEHLRAKNNLQKVILKIAAKLERPELQAEIKRAIAHDLNVDIQSVRRYLRNESQPSFARLQRILLLLKKYDPAITGGDLMGDISLPIQLKNPLK